MGARLTVADELLIKWRVVYRWSYQRMILENYRITGNRVSVQCISNRLKLYGLTEKLKRFDQHLPWKLHEDDWSAHISQMLRAQGARAEWESLSEEERQKILADDVKNKTKRKRPFSDKTAKALDAFERKLRDDNKVIDYDYDDGYSRVPRVPEDGNGWIRRPGTIISEPGQEAEPDPFFRELEEQHARQIMVPPAFSDAC